jgi:predicted nucleotidyltransferase component of viral defense system
MTIPRETLLAQAQQTGFRAEVLEKVFQLFHLLQNLNSHPALQNHLALKGGTALNLFHFPLPRLSVDIDLNYIGSVTREELDRDRPAIESAVQAVFEREGLAIRRAPGDHAGGKWRLRYESALSGEANLEVDLNFLLRVPLWDLSILDSISLAGETARQIPVLNIHELAAGKLAALFGRHASRDLFDVHQLLLHAKLAPERLRLGFILYGAMSRTDWRTLSPDAIAFDKREVQSQLVPLLPQTFLPPGESIKEFSTRLVRECQAALQFLFPFSEGEREFLDRLLDHGELQAELLTKDKDLARRISTHPGLLWKALNVRNYRRR